MKKIFIALLVSIPFFSIAQKIEISEQAGAAVRIESGNNRSGSTSYIYTYDNVSRGGFSNLLKATYLIGKHFSLGILYQYSILTTPTHSFGVTSDFKFKIINFGVDLRDTKVNNGVYVRYPVTQSPAITYSAYMGLTEKISKHLYLKQTVGVAYYKLHSELDVPFSIPANTTFVSTSDQNIISLYLVAGIAYRF